MDFIIGFPTTARKHDSIMEVVDKLTKTMYLLARIYQGHNFRLRFEVHFKLLERIILGIGHKAKFQHNLPLANRREDRESKPGIRRHVMNVHDGQDIKAGRLPAFGIIHLQQW